MSIGVRPQNLRDLGGLPLRGGGATRSGAVWRSAHLDDVDAAGWRSLIEAGITTVLDLRNASERPSAPSAPDGIRVLHLPLEDVDDPAYTTTWDQDWATPAFYAWGRRRWPELWTAVLDAVATAPGGVLIHCAGGRDRTGAVCAVLLEAAGVERPAILGDYRRGIREGSRRDVDGHVDDYVAAMDVLLDDLDPEPELRRAAARLR